jgi:hypothetical protein
MIIAKFIAYGGAKCRQMRGKKSGMTDKPTNDGRTDGYIKIKKEILKRN